MAADAPAGSVSGRLGAAVIGTALAGLAVWIAMRNLSLPTQDGWIFWVPIVLWLLTMSLLCWSVVVPGRARRAGVRSSWQAGWMVGGIGLLLGFVGPLVVTPRCEPGAVARHSAHRPPRFRGRRNWRGCCESGERLGVRYWRDKLRHV